MKLSQKKCIPCESGSKPMASKQVKELLKELPNGWKALADKKIQKEFNFKSYPQTIAFVNKVALIAQEQGHHPNLHVGYSNVVVELWTHSVNGLSENDFILAAKIEAK